MKPALKKATFKIVDKGSHFAIMPSYCTETPTALQYPLGNLESLGSRMTNH